VPAASATPVMLPVASWKPARETVNVAVFDTPGATSNTMRVEPFIVIAPVVMPPMA
jgi:hypothetical protein